MPDGETLDNFDTFTLLIPKTNAFNIVSTFNVYLEIVFTFSIDYSPFYK